MIFYAYGNNNSSDQHDQRGIFFVKTESRNVISFYFSNHTVSHTDGYIEPQSPSPCKIHIVHSMQALVIFVCLCERAA